MNRKTIKTRTGAYHVTLPIRMVEDFDDTLDYKQSRSRMIARLIENYLKQGPDSVSLMTDRQLIGALMARFEPNTFQYDLLYSMSQSISSNDDPSSS